MRRLFALIILFLYSTVAHAAPDSVRVRVAGDSLVVENVVVRRVWTFGREGRPAAITPASIYDKIGRNELLNRRASIPWFSLDVDHNPVRSQDPVWIYRDHTTVDLKHGGRETVVNLEASAGVVRGLRLRYTVQAYPGSGVFREQLTVVAPEPLDYRLTWPRTGALTFPGYAFASGDRRQAREIQFGNWGAELLDTVDVARNYDERTDPGWRKDANLAQNYMFHPARNAVAGSAGAYKGPVLVQLVPSGRYGYFMAYEHGSPDAGPNRFLSLTTDARGGLSVTGSRAVHFDGESLRRPFETWWAEVGVFRGTTFDAGEAALWDFLLNWINDEPASREPLFYYNTWGMQRDYQRRGVDVHAVLTEARVRQEIALADELGVDMFVLDDGWQEAFGAWRPHPVRFPDGLEPIRRDLVARGLTFGIWMGPTHVDSAGPVVREHPDWLIRDAAGNPVQGRWKPNFLVCLVSDYYDDLIRQAKTLIDAGVTHIKWDGLDADYHCNSPLHHHGDASVPPDAREARYSYEYPRTIVRAIRDLKAYNPEVVIEFDVTEPERNVGLAVLSEARFFWINNGASWYGDRSQYRAKSMRQVPNLWHGLIPPVLMTGANYPHDDRAVHSQRYNVATSLLGGLGFWGDLSDMAPDERKRVAETVGLAKRVARTVFRVRPKVIGGVGSSPEVYAYVDAAAAEGQVIAFSGTPGAYRHAESGIDRDRLLAVLRTAYRMDGDSLTFTFDFPAAESAREAFVLSNGGAGISIVSSTSWLKDARIDDAGNLMFTPGFPGTHRLRVRGRAPRVSGRFATMRTISQSGGYAIVDITTRQANVEVTVTR